MAGPERFELPTAGFEDQDSSSELRTVIVGPDSWLRSKPLCSSGTCFH